MLRPYHTRVREELERRGGTVEKFIGDAVMALFGAPTAHEDDPERAVRACLAIRDWAIAEKGVQVRIAATTGEALIGSTPGPRPVKAWPPGTSSTRPHGCSPPLPSTESSSTSRPTVPHGTRSTTARPSRLRQRGKRSSSPSGRRSSRARRFGRRRSRRGRARRPRAGDRRSLGGVRSCARRSLTSARHARGGSRNRQKPPPVRALAPRRRRAGAHDVAPGKMPRIRRRHHALGACRDRQGPGRHPRGDDDATAAEKLRRAAEEIVDPADADWVAALCAHLQGSRTRPS